MLDTLILRLRLVGYSHLVQMLPSEVAACP
jgi:hypothetical protein